MTALRCPACETTHYTAVTGPHLERVAQFGCDACGSAGPLRPDVRAGSATVDDGVTIAAGEQLAERES